MAEAGSGAAGGYVAFISYSHKDAAIGRWLHRRLEGYRLPRRLAGTQGEDGEVPERLTPIFRDRDELPAAGDLSERVRGALAGSRNLIVVCSPNSAASPWVAREISTFRELHPDRPIFTAIVEGQPSQCFPPALREGGVEPLAADLRTEGDGRHLGILKLVAGLSGVGLDALVQRDATRRVRRIMIIGIAAVIGMLLMAYLAVAASRARTEADRQRAAAEGLVEFMLTDLRFKLDGVRRLDIMYAVNQRALQYYDMQLAVNGRAADAARLARVQLAAGEVELYRGNKVGAFLIFDKTYKMTSDLLARSQHDQDVLFSHAQSSYWVGYSAYLRGNKNRTKRAWEQYKMLADRLLVIDRNNPKWLREAGYAAGNLCTLAMMPPANGVLAQELCQAALGKMDEAHRLRPKDPQIIQDLANRHSWLVDVMGANGDWKQAKLHLQQHQELLRLLIQSDPANVDYRDISMRSSFGFAAQFAQHREYAEARRRLRSAAQTVDFLIARDPENAEWQAWKKRISLKQGELT